MNKVDFVPFSIVVRGRLVEFSRPAVMGILNVTDDSFYDGGRYRETAAMLAQAERMLAEGADIVDIGASSSRPGATLLPPDEEARRLVQAVSLLRSRWPEAILSVDTCYSLPARAAIEAGADIVNDIGGGDIDPTMFETVAELQVPYILMHGGKEHVAGVKSMKNGAHEDVIDEMVRFFSSRLDRLYRLGVKDVWLDPGFGFAKDVDENYEVLMRLDELTSLFHEPLLAALSRKRMIYTRLNTTAEEALYGTVALDTLALERGARLVRVHDVKPATDTIKLLYNQ